MNWKIMGIGMVCTVPLLYFLARGFEFNPRDLPDEMANAPDFTRSTLDGYEISLKDLKGGPIVLNFWSSWCKPCLAELKYLNKLAEKNKDKMVVLAISIDGPQTQARVNQKTRRFKNITVLLDPSGATNPTSQVPYTIFVNTLGKQCYDKRGFIRGDEQEIENKVNELNGASSR